LLQARETLRQEVRLGFDQLNGGGGIVAATVYERAERGISGIQRSSSDGL
jgi:hypothetical protein